jgi:fatty acid desaturase
MIRRVLTGPGAFIVAPVALLAVLAAAWYAGAGLVVGLIHAPALGVLAAAAAFTAHEAVHPTRVTALIRKA